MLSEGTLLSGGEKDRKIIAWDSLQNYKKVTESKVTLVRILLIFNFRNFLKKVEKSFCCSLMKPLEVLELFILKDLGEMMAISMWVL